MNNRFFENGIGYYPVGKENFPSVTSILSATKPEKDKLALRRWREKVGEEEADRISKEACKRGTEMHLSCEKLLLGEPLPELSEIAKPFWESIKPEVQKIEHLYIEQFVSNSTLRYAGSLDAFGTYDGIENTLIDFKTAKKETRMEWIQDYCLQTVAYAAALKETYGVRTNQVAILIATPDQNAQVFKLSRDRLKYYWEMWELRVKAFWEIHANT